jgi:competence protein ComEC
MCRNRLLSATTCLAALLVQFAPGAAAAQTRTTLDVYTIDVEGGNATLFVAPSGESLLMDTGNMQPEPVAAARNASRIIEAAKDAGLTP